ncbi:uncharacterized protein LOC135849383 [Planococcus citri]|uniref:uncharacterized protein LOC135849383 n=1 Tax=Planococcus citri TaxID=170843 RepID=UPI0031F7C7EA
MLNGNRIRLNLQSLIRSVKSNIVVIMASVAGILIVAGILLYLGLRTNANPNTESKKQEELTSWKIPKNSCPNGTDKIKDCLKCYQSGYAYYFDAKIRVSGTDQGCSDNTPLQTFINTDEYNNNNDGIVSCQIMEDYPNDTSEMNATFKSTGIPNNILEYSRFIGCFNYENDSFKPDLFKTEWDEIDLIGTNSNKRCLIRCQLKGYEYAGTRNGSQCLCTKESPKHRAKDDFLCEKLNCPGEPTEMCGDADKIKLYHTHLMYEKQRNPQYIGCYTVNYNDSSCHTNTYNVTNPLSCIATCKKRRFNYSSFNISSGNHCICRNLPPLKIREISEYGCNNTTRTCDDEGCENDAKMMIYDNGISDNPYDLNAYAFINYFNLTKDSRAELLKTINTTFDNSLLTNCHRYCVKSGFKFFSVQVKNLALNGTNCFCSNIDIGDLEGLTEKRSDKSENADIFVFETGLSDVDIDEMDTKCYQMNGAAKELWTDTTTFFNMRTLTPKTCQMICDYLRYSYSAVEKGSDCHCFHNLNEKKNSTPTRDIDCNIRCLGDPFQTCGGSGYHMQVSETPFAQKIIKSNQLNITQLEEMLKS